MIINKNPINKNLLVYAALLFVPIILTLTVSFFKARNDAQYYLDNTFFEGFKNQLGELFYSSRTNFYIKGELVTKQDGVWTISSSNKLQQVQVGSEANYIQTGADHKKISTWKLITADSINPKDQVLINTHFDFNRNQLEGHSVRKIVE